MILFLFFLISKLKLEMLSKISFSEKAKKFGAIVLKVLTKLGNVKTLRTIAPNFCVLFRKAELYRTEMGHGVEFFKIFLDNDFDDANLALWNFTFV